MVEEIYIIHKSASVVEKKNEKIKIKKYKKKCWDKEKFSMGKKSSVEENAQFFNFYVDWKINCLAHSMDDVLIESVDENIAP